MILRAPFRLLIALLALAAPAAGLRAWDFANEGQPLVRRHDSSDYGASGAVLAFCATPAGDIFVGSDNLLQVLSLYYFKKIATAKDYGFRALAADNQNRVWAGSVSEVGYLAADATGEFAFTSLREQFTRDLGAPPRDILAVSVAGGRVHFLGRQALFLWDGAHFTRFPLPSSQRLQPLRPTPEQLWITQAGRGVLAPAADGVRLVAAEAELPGALTWLLAPTKADTIGEGWLAGTADGAFVRRGGAWVPLPGLSGELHDAVATCAIRIDATTAAVATQNRGVYVFHDDGLIVSHLTRDNGLSDNQAHTLWLDPRGNLWIGTATGWTNVTPPQRISYFSTGGPRLSDPVRSTAQLDGTVYVAATSGVYRIAAGTQPDETAHLVALPATPGPALNLVTAGGALFAGGTGGLWRWTGQAWSTVHDTKGDVLTLAVSRRHLGELFFTDGYKLFAARADGNRWRVYPLHEDVGDTPVSLLEDDAGDLLVSTVLKGVIRYRPAPQADGLPGLEKRQQFRPGAELPADAKRPLLVQASGRIVLFNETGILALNAAGTAFEPIGALRMLRGIAAGPPEANGHARWILELIDRAMARTVALADVHCDAAGQWHCTLLGEESLVATGRPVPGSITLGETAAGPVAWVALSRGLLQVGPSQFQPAPPPPPARIRTVQATGARQPNQIRALSVMGADVPQGIRLPLDVREAIVPIITQNLQFDFGFASGAVDSLFQTQLIGLEETWNANNFLGTREFTGLAPGHYEFRARAIDRLGRPGPEAAYRFQVLAPWYYRRPAWLAYAALLALAVWAGYRWRVRQLQLQNDRLNRMVAERTRELALANDDKMDFLASISHEIRTPLNGVTGLVDLLKTASLGPREHALAQSLAACARSLRRVFDEVLGFARLEQGRVAVRARPFRLAPLLHDVAGVFAAEAAQRGSRLTVRADDAGRTLLGDDEKIRTIVNNFVANALKYAPGSPIDVDASMEAAAGGRWQVTIQVRDQGPGIPAEEQELIFRKFVRGSQATVQRETGAGLGLATCQALASLLGGHVGVESTAAGDGEPGGSTFYLQVPLELSTEAVAEIPPPSIPGIPVAGAPPPVPPGKLSRALVVEDHEYNQLVARSIVERLGYEADVAADLRGVQACLAAHEYALVLLDWDVPGAKGDELARLVRRRPDGARPVVLALTAHDSDDIRQRCLEAGMDGFLVKPLDEALLTLTVRETLQRRRSQGSGGGKDFHIFDYLGRNNPVLSQQAAGEYLAQLEQGFASLQAAAAAGDRAQVARRAHHLQAHAAVVRFQALNETARRLQQLAATDGDYAALMTELARHVEQLRTELAEFLNHPATRP